jgi:hypothetical protein
VDAIGEKGQREAAVEAMKLFTTGNLRFKDSQPLDGGMRRYIYSCPEVDGNGVPCPFRASVRSHVACEGGMKMWTTWVRITVTKGQKEKYFVIHNHEQVSVRTVGLPLDVKLLIDSEYPQGKKTVAMMSEALLIDNLKGMLLATPDRKHIATDDTKWESFKTKVKNYVRYGRRKNDAPLRSVQDIITICKAHEIKTPLLYIPRSDYTTPKELADALHIPSADDMILSHLGYDKNLKALMKRLEEECMRSKNRFPTELEKQKYGDDVLVAFAVCSPATLFRLMQLANLPEGLRVLYRDGTHGACKDGSKLIVHLTGDTKYRETASTVTSTPVVTHYIVSPEESLGSTIAGDLWLQDICQQLFGVKLELDYAESDGADGFISGAIIAWENLKSVLNCTFHVTKLLGTTGKSTLKKKFTLEELKKDAPELVRKLQFCKTQQQFDSCLNLLCEEWSDLGETEAADYITIEHGTYPHNKWWYCSAGKYKKAFNYESQLFLNLIYFAPLSVSAG